MKKSFDRNNRSGGGGERNFGNRSFGSNSGSGERRPSTLHKAVCGKCGMACEVPFRPSSDRPVLCKNCFRRDGDSEPRSTRYDSPKRFGGSEQSSPSYGGGSDQTQKQLTIINAKLDKILGMLEEFEDDDDDD